MAAPPLWWQAVETDLERAIQLAGWWDGAYTQFNT